MYTNLHVHSFIHPSIHQFFHSFHPSIYPCMHACIHSFISFIQHPLLSSFTEPVWAPASRRHHIAQDLDRARTGAHAYQALPRAQASDSCQGGSGRRGQLQYLGVESLVLRSVRWHTLQAHAEKGLGPLGVDRKEFDIDRAQGV